MRVGSPPTLLAVALVALAHPLPAQADEIQVYDGSLAAPGTFNLTLQDNYTPSGSRRPFLR